MEALGLLGIARQMKDEVVAAGFTGGGGGAVRGGGEGAFLGGGEPPRSDARSSLLMALSGLGIVIMSSFVRR
jgi:hypothetical protein